MGKRSVKGPKTVKSIALNERQRAHASLLETNGGRTFAFFPTGSTYQGGLFYLSFLRLFPLPFYDKASRHSSIRPFSKANLKMIPLSAMHYTVVLPFVFWKRWSEGGCFRLGGGLAWWSIGGPALVPGWGYQEQNTTRLDLTRVTYHLVTIYTIHK